MYTDWDVQKNKNLLESSWVIGRWKSDKHAHDVRGRCIDSFIFFAEWNNSEHTFLGAILFFRATTVINCLKISGNKNNFGTIWGWNRQRIKNSPASAESYWFLLKKGACCWLWQFAWKWLNIIRELSGRVSRKSSSLNINDFFYSCDRRFDQKLEKLLLVRHFVTFEVAQLTCHDIYDMLWSGNPHNWSIFANLSRFCHYSRGLKCYEWQRLLWTMYEWQRLFQMATTVYESENCVDLTQ